MFKMGIPGKVVFWYWDRFQFIDFLSFVAMTLHVIRIKGSSYLATSNTQVLFNSTFGDDLDEDLYSAVHQLEEWCASRLAQENILVSFFLYIINTLRLRQYSCHLPDDIFKCIFLNENVWILIKISLKFIPMGPIDNIPALVQVMAWHQSGNKPLSEPMMVFLTDSYMHHSASMS